MARDRGPGRQGGDLNAARHKPGGSAPKARPITGFHHLAIKVADLAAAERFYAGVLGLAVLRRWPGSGATGRTAGPAAATARGERALWLDAGDGSFIAVERETAAIGARKKPRAALGHHVVALRVRRGDREAWQARLLDAGVEITGRSQYTLYFADPEGNRIALSHHPEKVLLPVAGEPAE